MDLKLDPYIRLNLVLTINANIYFQSARSLEDVKQPTLSWI